MLAIRLQWLWNLLIIQLVESSPLDSIRVDPLNRLHSSSATAHSTRLTVSQLQDLLDGGWDDPLLVDGQELVHPVLPILHVSLEVTVDQQHSLLENVH